MPIRRAMVFAAGLGTRMRPLTDHCPKPLVQLAGKALLDYTLERFEAHGVERIVVNTHYLAERVDEHLAKRAHRCEVLVSHESLLLETGGGIVHALPLLGEEPFFSANADAFWRDAPGASALAALEARYDPAELDALLLVAARSRTRGYHGPGNFHCASDGTLRWDSAGDVFTGVSLMHPRWFAGRSAVPFSLRELYRAATDDAGQLQRVRGASLDGEFMHVGSPAELAEVEAALKTSA